MDSKRCSFYWGSGDNLGEPAHVIEILEWIIDGRWSDVIEKTRSIKNRTERNKYKAENLPAVTFAAVLSRRIQMVDNVIEYSQVIPLDFDKYPPRDHRKIKQLLKEDPYISVVFDSPSGRLKALFVVDSQVEHHRDLAFVQVEEYILETYGLEIDPSGKDFTRLCYVSYDPDLYWCNDYEIFKVDLSTSNFISVGGFKYGENYEPSISIKEVFDTANEWAGRKNSYVQGNRNNYIFNLACILNRAGMEEEIALNQVFKRYSGLGFSEVSGVVHSAYKHNQSEFGIREILKKKGNQTNMFRS
jgi:hypothetical protein